MQSSYVILVNEQDKPVGTMEKMEAHEKGLLHRAFSIFIFNKQGEMLLQQRSEEKYHSPALWTNACCSHPSPDESTDDAAARRLKEEMGFVTSLTKIFDFTYQASFSNGLTEHEFDHVYIGEFNGSVIPHEDEVMDHRFFSIAEIKSSMEKNPDQFTAWFLIAFPKVEEYLAASNL